MIKKYWPAILTLLLGFIPITVLSLANGVFWIDSRVRFPMVTSVIMLLGDSLILPVLNYRTWRIYLKTENYVFNNVKNLIIICALTTVSVLINVYTHFFVWTKDAYTGLFDFEYGKLSIIGWWHLGYSILQMIVIMFLVVLIFVNIRDRREKNYEYCFRTWRIYMLFCALEIPTFFVKHIFVLKTKDIFAAFMKEYSTFFLLGLSVLLYVITVSCVRINHKNIKTN